MKTIATIIGLVGVMVMGNLNTPSHIDAVVADPMTHEIKVTKNQIKLSKDDLNCLALNIFHEAGVESHKGKIAVAQVTLNRAKSKRWGDTVCDVVYAKAQFSWTLFQKNHKVMPEGPLWEKSLQAAKAFVAGESITALSDAMFYHTDYIKTPKWADEKYSIKQIGRHIFYTKARQAESKEERRAKAKALKARSKARKSYPV